MADLKQVVAFEVQVADALKAFQALSDGFKQVGASARAGLGELPKAGGHVDDLSKSFRDFKREQVQEGRLTGFYVRELTEFAGVSKEAQTAVGGLTQGVIGLFTATGPLLYAWAGFEIIKGVAGYFHEVSAAAEKASKEAIDHAMAMQNAILGLNRAVAGLPQISSATEKYTELIRLKREAEGYDAEAASSSGGEAMLARNRAKELWAGFGARGGDAELQRLAIQMARENVETAAEYESKAREKALRDAEEAVKKRNDMEKAALDERLKIVTDHVALVRAQWDADSQNMLESSDPLVRITSFKEAMDEQKRMAEEQKQWMDSIKRDNGKHEEMDPENMLGSQDPNVRITSFQTAMREVKEQETLARSLEQAWVDVGSAMSGAFSALGNAIGGAAGKFLSSIGEMISQAIKFAVAMAAASVAQTPVIGGLMAAAAAIGLATSLAATIASIPSYDVGTAYVPRTGLAMIHEGERIIPAAENRAMGAGGSNVTVNLNVTAMNGQDVYRTLTASRGELARVVREAVRDGVM